jgi:hypothetical protein
MTVYMILGRLRIEFLHMLSVLREAVQLLV